MKLGVVGESWLRHEVFGRECTAATCLYFFWEPFVGASAGSDTASGPLACEWPNLLVMASGASGASVAVTVAVLIAVAIMMVAGGIISVDGRPNSH